MKKKLRAIVEDSHFFELKSGSRRVSNPACNHDYKLKKSESQIFLIEM
jgi:hypothetical protein